MGNNIRRQQGDPESSPFASQFFPHKVLPLSLSLHHPAVCSPSILGLLSDWSEGSYQFMELSSGPSPHQPHESLNNFTNLLEPLLISKMEDHGHSMGADSKCETCRKGPADI